MNQAGILVLLHDSRGRVIEEAERLRKEATDSGFIVYTEMHLDTELTKQNLVLLSGVEAVFIPSLEALGHTQEAVIWALNELFENAVQRIYIVTSNSQWIRIDYETIEVLQMFQELDVVLLLVNAA